MNIRPFTEEDVEIAVPIWNLLNPDWPTSVPEVLDDYRKRDPKYLLQSYVAELDGQLVGVGESDLSVASYHPQKFHLTLYVHPDFHGQGIGKALYEKVLESLKPHNPISARVQVRESSERALRFFGERGFVETKRDWVSVLDVASCDLTPYEGLESTLTSEDLTFTTLGELQTKDLEAFRKFVPRAEPATPISYEFFLDNIINAPDFDGRMFLVALDGEDYIGFTGMYPFGDTKALDQWLTGVKRDYRKRNIALALKIQAIRFAKENSYISIRTDKRGAANLSLLKEF